MIMGKTWGGYRNSFRIPGGVSLVMGKSWGAYGNFSPVRVITFLVLVLNGIRPDLPNKKYAACHIKKVEFWNILCSKKNALKI